MFAVSENDANKSGKRKLSVKNIAKKEKRKLKLMTNDDAMDGSNGKRQSVKDITKKEKKKRKSGDAAFSKKIYSHVEKKKKKVEKDLIKNIKKLSKGFKNLNTDEALGKKEKKVAVKLEADAEESKKTDNASLRYSYWVKAMKDLAEIPTLSDFKKEVIQKCENHIVPYAERRQFINWVTDTLNYDRAKCYVQLRSLYRSIKKQYIAIKPRTKTERRRLEKKRSKIRKQMEAIALKKEGVIDEKTEMKRKMKRAVRKEKLKKKKLENILKLKSGLKKKGKLELSEEKKDSIMKEIKKSKKNKQKIKVQM